MPRGFGRLPFLARRDGAAAQSRLDESAGSDRRIDDDDAPVGPPVLLPAMIHRMILVDATELTPVWARPRAAGAPVGEAPAPARTELDRPTLAEVGGTPIWTQEVHGLGGNNPLFAPAGAALFVSDGWGNRPAPALRFRRLDLSTGT